MPTRVLVFCRPYLVEDYEANVAPLRPAYDFRFLVDGLREGVADTRQRFYARLETAGRPAGFSEADELDVVERCRFLRNLSRSKALSLLRAMASVLSEELDSYAPQVVFSLMVDDYITHLLSELARRRGLAYIGMAYSYFPDKAQLTLYANGAALDAREPSDAETAEVLAQISQRTFRQNYQQKDSYTRARHFKAMVRYRIKQLVFRLKGWLQNDPLHMHYACLPYVVERRRWSDFPSARDFHADWRARVQANEQLGIGRKPVLYFPLGYFPEATIDYWIGDKRALAYEQTVLAICRTLSPHFQLVIKEHLHMLGARSTSFYRAMRDMPGIVSVPPLSYSNDVLERADAVLMGAGSIGVESFIRGKAIVSYCETSYWFASARAAGVRLDALNAWPQTIRSAINDYVAPTEKERFEFIRQCLRSTLRQHRGKVWPIAEPAELEQTLRVAMGLPQGVSP